MKLPKIICASDIPFNLDCLNFLLSKSSDLELKLKINLEDLLHETIYENFDVLVLDVCEQTDSDHLHHVFNLFQDKKIMILTSSNNHYFLSSMLHLGARGCFIKTESVDMFIKSIIDLYSNNAYLPDELFNKLYCELPIKFNNGVKRTLNDTHQEVPILNLDILTPREHEILKLIIAGEQSSQIADELFISEYTVSTHRKHIMKKLGVKNTSTLIRCALEQGEI